MIFRQLKWYFYTVLLLMKLGHNNNKKFQQGVSVKEILGLVFSEGVGFFPVHMGSRFGFRSIMVRGGVANLFGQNGR